MDEVNSLPQQPQSEVPQVSSQSILQQQSDETPQLPFEPVSPPKKKRLLPILILITVLVSVCTTTYFVYKHFGQTRYPSAEENITKNTTNPNESSTQRESGKFSEITEPQMLSQPYNRPKLEGNIVTDQQTGNNIYTDPDGLISFSYPLKWEVCTIQTDQYQITIDLEPRIADENGNYYCDLIKMFSSIYVSYTPNYTKTKQELKAGLLEIITDDSEYRNHSIKSMGNYTEVDNVVHELTISGTDVLQIYEFGTSGPIQKSYYLLNEENNELITVQASMEFGKEHEAVGALEVAEQIVESLTSR